MRKVSHMDRRGDILQSGRDERGIALVAVLMFLVIMTMIGMAAMQSSGLQDRMSGNMRDQDIAFQAAENAVREGEQWIDAQVAHPAVSPSNSGNCAAPCTNVVWALNANEINAGNFLNRPFWDLGTNLRIGTAIPGDLNPPLSLPRYAIEWDRFVADDLVDKDVGRQIYRVTARGTGRTDAAQTVIQTTYAKRY